MAKGVNATARVVKTRIGGAIPKEKGVSSLQEAEQLEPSEDVKRFDICLKSDEEILLIYLGPSSVLAGPKFLGK